MSFMRQFPSIFGLVCHPFLLDMHSFIWVKEVWLNANRASIIVWLRNKPRFHYFHQSNRSLLIKPRQICSDQGVVAVNVSQSYKCTAGHNELQLCVEPLSLFPSRTPAPIAATCTEWSDIQEKPFITICFGGTYLNPTKSEARLLSIRSLTLCACVNGSDKCATVHVLSVCIHASM